MTNTNHTIFNLPANDLLTLSFLLSLLLSNGLNSNQLNILGNFLCSLGQNILTIQSVVGALPDNAIYTIKSNPAYCKTADQASAGTPSPQELEDEITALRERLERFELLLTLKKAQHNPDENADADTDQSDWQRNK